jgi:hypothetical protein
MVSLVYLVKERVVNQINLYDAKTNLSSLVDRAAAGEEVICCSTPMFFFGGMMVLINSAV